MEPITFMRSLGTFYMKGEIAGDRTMINVAVPNTLFFGLIPLGKKNRSVPVTQIASVTTSTKVKGWYLLFGLIMLLTGFASFGDSAIAGLICCLLAAYLFISAFETLFIMKMTSAEEIQVYFIVFEKDKAKQAETAVNHLIIERLNDTNVRDQMDRSIYNAQVQTDRMIASTAAQTAALMGMNQQMQQQPALNGGQPVPIQNNPGQYGQYAPQENTFTQENRK